MSARPWWQHFMGHPLMLLAPLLGFFGFTSAWLVGKGRSNLVALLLSSLGMAGILLTVGFGLFPFLLISATDPRSSLTLWDSCSSQGTLVLAFWITVIFLPIVLLYTRWVYKVL